MVEVQQPWAIKKERAEKPILTGEVAEKLEKKIKEQRRTEFKAELKSRLREISRGGLITGKRLFKAKEKRARRAVKRRERATRGILTAAGIIAGKQTYKGAGRPRGTYLHGMPIQVYKKMLREKKALYQRYQEEQYVRLRPKGFTPEQIQQLQQQQSLQELEQPSISRVQQIQQRVQEMQMQDRQPIQQIQIIPQRQPSQYQKMRVPTNQKSVQPGPSIADEELAFRKWSAETTISPHTQRILDTIRRIQNKGKSDNIEQQRRNSERILVGRSMSLFDAHKNMIDTTMDFTGVSQDNPLMAPNIWKENPEDNILRNTRGRFSILNTKDGGNDLKFF